MVISSSSIPPGSGLWNLRTNELIAVSAPVEEELDTDREDGVE